MSFLDSILSSIDKTAEKTKASPEELERRRKKREADELEKKRLAKARAQFMDHLTTFKKKLEENKNEEKKDKMPQLRFKPMDPSLRAVLGGVANELGLLSHSFGDEGIDRFMIIYAPPGPTEEELYVLKRNKGEFPKDPEEFEAQMDEARRITEARALASQVLPFPQRKPSSKSSVEDLPPPSAPSDDLFLLNQKKRDLRSIEEIQKDMKKRRVNNLRCPITPANSMEGIPIPLNSSTDELSSSSGSTTMAAPPSPN